MSFQTDSLGVTLPNAWVEEAKLVASNKVANDNFGYSVSISADGSTLVVGSYLADRNATDTGAAYIYTKVNDVWTQQYELMASDRVASDYFGWSVSIDATGTTAVVGSRLADNAGAINSGATYVFTRTGEAWSQVAKLTASDKVQGDLFGWSVAVSEDATTIAVGATYADPSGTTDSGAVYIFALVEGVYTQQAKLVAGDKAQGDQFGTSVGISSLGNTVIVGSRYADPNGVLNAGAGYVFSRSSDVWTQQAKLVTNDKAANDNAATAVAVSGDGNRAIVGAFQADPNNTINAGAVYAFTRLDNVWSQEVKLVASDKAAGDNLGWPVAISSDGNTIVTGAYYNDPNGITNAGAVYTFTIVDGVWSQAAKLVASDKANSDYFGWAVSASSDGGTVVSSARLADAPGAFNAGAVYVYKA